MMIKLCLPLLLHLFHYREGNILEWQLFNIPFKKRPFHLGLVLQAHLEMLSSSSHNLRVAFVE
jgi:hypothetical protein